jgi:hypothetical protein
MTRDIKAGNTNELFGFNDTGTHDPKREERKGTGFNYR